MIRTVFAFTALLTGATLTGCASSQTEAQFGNAVRSTIADQRMQPQPPDGAPAGTDGQRVESVLSVYRTRVGDPAPVVNTIPVERN